MTDADLAISKISEIQKITGLMSIFKRAPHQLNKIYESDSEIIDLGLEKNISKQNPMTI